MSCDQLSGQAPDRKENVFTLRRVCPVPFFLRFIGREAVVPGGKSQGAFSLWFYDTKTRVADTPRRSGDSLFLGPKWHDPIEYNQTQDNLNDSITSTRKGDRGKGYE